MRKTVSIILSCLFAMLLSINNFAAVYKCDFELFRDTYECYRVGNVLFLTPTNYQKVEQNIAPDKITFSDDNSQTRFIISTSDRFSEEPTLDNVTPIFESLVKKTYKNLDVPIGIIQEQKYRDYTFYICKTECEKLSRGIKEAVFYNTSDNLLYMLIIFYSLENKNSVYLSDFDKCVSTDPMHYTKEYVESTQPYYYSKTITPTIGPRPQSSNSSSDSDWQALHDYLDILDQYVDTMESLDNGTLGDALGNVINFYGSVYDYANKYGN